MSILSLPARVKELAWKPGKRTCHQFFVCSHTTRAKYRPRVQHTAEKRLRSRSLASSHSFFCFLLYPARGLPACFIEGTIFTKEYYVQCWFLSRIDNYFNLPEATAFTSPPHLPCTIWRIPNGVPPLLSKMKSSLSASVGVVPATPTYVTSGGGGGENVFVRTKPAGWKGEALNNG